MNTELRRYIGQLKGVDLEVSENALNHLSSVMKRDLWKTPSEEGLRKAKEWMHSPLKRNFEKTLALLVVMAGGKLFVEWAERKIEKIDQEDGVYRWEVGFFNLPEDSKTSSFKIRTMRVGSETELESPFQHTSFKHNVNDPRILDSNFVRFLRRSGLDGLTEIIYGVNSGEWSLVSPRPYNTHELEGTGILYKLILDGELALSKSAGSVLESYPGKVEFFEPKPGVFGPLAAFNQSVSHLTRMRGDIAYWENASLPVDFRLFFGGIYQRILRGVNAK